MSLLTNLEAYYKVDENTGTTLGDEVNSRDGTITSATWNTTGILNNSLTFDGANDYAQVADDFIGTASLTFNIWVWIDSAGNGTRRAIAESYMETTVAGWCAVALEINTDNKIRTFFVSPDFLGSNVVGDPSVAPTNQWVMVTYVRNGTSGGSLYVNATQVATTGITTGDVSTLTDVLGFNVGTYRGADGRWFEGREDEIGIWSRVLTGAEITDLYNSGSALAYPFGTGPTVTTQAASSVGETSATLNGNLTDLNGETSVSTAFDYRVVGAGSWTRTTPNTGVTATGAYTESLTGLTDTEDYEYRAVVIYNTTEEVFGSEVTFTTLTPDTAPTVTTQAVSSIGTTTATGNGNVTSDGGATITERGVCWATTTTPTIADSTATSAGTTGAFTASMTGLTAGTTYYVRAYATNAEGTSYGSEVTFDTLAANVAPTVTTQAVSSITDITATGNGNVTSDGGATITERGVCWSTSVTPTTADSTATAAGTTGAFTASLTGLTAETTYYARAYAINSEGTSYGSQVDFTTTATPETTTRYAAKYWDGSAWVRLS